MLEQNYPNPFNHRTNIRYSLPSSEHREESTEQRAQGGEERKASTLHALRTTLKIYNILGQEVRTLVDELKELGYYTVSWDGMDRHGNEVASGVYFYRLKAGNFIHIKRMVLLK